MLKRKRYKDKTYEDNLQNNTLIETTKKNAYL